jgi:uncharacterized membrane protein YqgA involved in biofilm formation
MIAVSDSALPVYDCQPAIAHFCKRIQQVTGAQDAVSQISGSIGLIALSISISSCSMLGSWSRRETGSCVSSW